jgi:hypothetical protein
MAKSYKDINTENDIVSTQVPLHEQIPLTGTIASGTYSDNNIKNYSHGMFQSVYDYPYLSSSANHIYDLTFGYSNDSALSGSSNEQNTKKINLYNQMAQVLMGYDTTGSIRRFDEDGNITDGGTKLDECVFINFARLLTKDEVKKGSFTMKIGTGSYADPFAGVITIQDTNADTAYKVNSPAGEYSILSCSAGSALGTTPACGLLFYQAGVAVLSGSIFTSSSIGIVDTNVQMNSDGETFSAVLTGSAISGNCDNFRHRIQDISFQNTTELNSTIHFCRLGSGDFNYSANPTYLTESKIRVKGENPFNEPVSYFTTVGLYSADNELLAVAKLSEPMKKTPSQEMTIKVRLDY